MDSQGLIRVAHLITSLDADGAQRFLSRLIAATDRKRFEHLVISMKGRGVVAGEIEGRAAVRTLDMNGRASDLAALWRLHTILRTYRPDLVHSWMVHSNVMAALMTARSTPLIWGIRESGPGPGAGAIMRRFVYGLSRMMSRRPQVVVANSQAGLEYYRDYGYRVDEWQMIPNGIDTEWFRPSPEMRVSMRAGQGLDPQTFVVGRAARYHPKKDFQTFLHAAALVAGRHADTRFLLAGAGVDEDNEELMRLISELGIESRVRLLSRFDDPRPFYASCDVIVSSSAWGEGFPNVIAEAMACGVPCVVTDSGDSATLVGRKDHVVDPAVPEQLARGIESIMALAPLQREELGAASRTRIVKGYSLEKAVRRHQELYDKVTSSC